MDEVGKISLKYTGSTTLKERKIGGDMIEVFGILKGISIVNYKTWFELSANSRTRDFSYKRIKFRSRLAVRK